MSDCGLAPPATVTMRASTPALAKASLMQTSGVVVTQLAHVARAQAPGLAGHHGGGHLAAGHAPLAAMYSTLEPGAGKRQQRDQRVGGVQAHADQVDLGQTGHSDIVMGRKDGVREGSTAKCCRLKEVILRFGRVLGPTNPSSRPFLFPSLATALLIAERCRWRRWPKRVRNSALRLLRRPDCGAAGVVPAGAGGREHLVCYAVKANSALAILKLLAARGAGFDIVSGGELERVLAAAPEAAGRVVFSGVGKTAAEIDLALRPESWSSTWKAKRSWRCWPRARAS